MLVEIPPERLPELVLITFMSFTFMGWAFWALIEIDTEIDKQHREIEDGRTDT